MVSYEVRSVEINCLLNYRVTMSITIKPPYCFPFKIDSNIGGVKCSYDTLLLFFSVIFRIELGLLKNIDFVLCQAVAWQVKVSSEISPHLQYMSYVKDK